MKTLTLNRSEAADYLRGERTFWRVMRNQPSKSSCRDFSLEPGDIIMYHGWPTKVVESTGRNKRDSGELTPIRLKCPYGQPGDVIGLRERRYCEIHEKPQWYYFDNGIIAAIAVERRGDLWGWVVTVKEEK